MPLDKTTSEYKIAWLRAALGGSAKTNLIELESLFYAANSGLAPAAKFSVNDHKMAYYRTSTATTTPTSQQDVEIKFFKARGATGSDYDELARNHWRDKPFP